MDVSQIRGLIREVPELVGKRLVVVGSGYVGLPLAVLKVLQGATVAVVDIDNEKITKLASGIPPFHEDGLPEFLAEAIQTGRISFHTDLVPLVKDAQVIYGCVGTPPNPDGSANLEAVFSIGKQIGKGVAEGQRLLVVQTSTVPPGTTRNLYQTIKANLNSTNAHTVDLVVADRPEFLQQGYAFRDNVLYDRKVAAVYPNAPWAKSLLLSVEHTNESAPFLWVDTLETAEMVKYAANAFLATKISFMNEISRWADAIPYGADVTQVAQAIGLDSRVGVWGLSAGLGFGGGCFPKDTSAAVDAMSAVGVESRLVSSAILINHEQVAVFVEKIRARFGGDLAKAVIACGGVTFKPDTDFVYPSQAYEVIKLLLQGGASVRVYDPVGLPNFEQLSLSRHSRLTLCPSLDELFDGADAYALLTEWPELVNVNLQTLSRLRCHTIFDGRNVMDKENLISSDFRYYGLGR